MAQLIVDPTQTRFAAPQKPKNKWPNRISVVLATVCVGGLLWMSGSLYQMEMERYRRDFKPVAVVSCQSKAIHDKKTEENVDFKSAKPLLSSLPEDCSLHLCSNFDPATGTQWGSQMSPKSTAPVSQRSDCVRVEDPTQFDTQAARISAEDKTQNQNSIISLAKAVGVMAAIAAVLISLRIWFGRRRRTAQPTEDPATPQ